VYAISNTAAERIRMKKSVLRIVRIVALRLVGCVSTIDCEGVSDNEAGTGAAQP
jgi:hypothetical protein